MSHYDVFRVRGLCCVKFTLSASQCCQIKDRFSNRFTNTFIVYVSKIRVFCDVTSCIDVSKDCSTLETPKAIYQFTVPFTDDLNIRVSGIRRYVERYI